ncbi:hypothetical protein MMC29_008451 [Sticta canariensis]|nr:hypothetical protein [Sticta canariensis]
MPPANPPSDIPREAATTNTSYLEQLAELASPVPDFAATLTTQAEQEADDDNVSFLRTQSSPVSSSSRAPPLLPMPNFAAGASNSVNTESQRRMRRVIEAVAGHRRYSSAQLQQLGDSQEASSTVPPMQAESHYQGWAPESLEYEDDFPPPIMNASVPGAEFHREPSRRSLRGGNPSQRESRIPQISQTSQTSQTLSPETYQFGEHEVEDLSEMTESTLRTTALLQTVRRNSQISSRARSQLQNYILNRERMGHDGEDRDQPRITRPSSSTSGIRPHRQIIQQQQQMLLHHTQQQQLQRQQRQQRNAQQRELQALQREWVQAQDHGHQIRPTRLPVETYRLRHLENPSVSPPIASRSLDDAIKYLERLRFCESLQDSLSSAKAGGFVPDELFANGDFVLDTATIEPPPESSWLKIGGVLSGSQHATGGSSLPPYVPYSRSAGSHSPLLDRPSQPLPATSTPSSRPTNTEQEPVASHTAPSTQVNPDGDERWAVKVTIHSIDYGSMTLSGTMEAFNVPDKTSPTQESSITTFLEGEIIDFNTYTLETKSFNANARVDGTYWRKLEPFKKLTDDEIVRALVSKKWLADELSRNWILMRWKEKCFVTPSDAQSSLTISGFYYISLRRSDGHVEGLYYDPLSAPYQHLSLMPEKRTFPAYRFQ